MRRPPGPARSGNTMTPGWSLIFSNAILRSDQTAFIHSRSVAPTDVFLLRQQCQGAVNRPGPAGAPTGPLTQSPSGSAGTDAPRSKVRVPLCRMWRMTGMLGAIMHPDNVLRLRAWLAVSAVAPSTGGMEKNGLLGIVGLSVHRGSLSFWATWTWSSHLTRITINYKSGGSRSINAKYGY